MNAVAQSNFLSIQDYLEGELHSDIRHEYIGGVAYAMAGGSWRHSRLSGAIFSQLLQQLGDSPCQPHNSDLKVLLNVQNRDIFYYPDVSVTCEHFVENENYAKSPKEIIEVTSPSTEGIDRREKFWNNIQIDSLEEYVLVSQERIEVTIFRRANDWKAEVYTDINQEVALPSLNILLSIRTIYRNVEL